MSLLEQLGKLAELKDNGVLTEAEFEAKKAEMLKKKRFEVSSWKAFAQDADTR